MKSDKNLFMKLRILLCLIFCIHHLLLTAQVHSFSAAEAVKYALDHNSSVQNAKIDTDIATAKVQETIGIGLPQINGSASILHYPEIQRFVLETGPAFPFGPPNAPAGTPVAFGLALENSLTGNIQATQLLFNGNYLVGLKASKTYQELSAKQLKQARTSIAEQVSKTYYSILVNSEKSRLLDLNLSRLDSTLREIKLLLKNGFVEQVDADRIEVSLNNLRSEKQKTARLLQLARYGLKLQMGMPVSDSLILSGKLDEVNPDSIEAFSGNVDYNRRIEYSTLQTQKALAGLDLKNVQAGYYPSVAAIATLGVNSAASKFSNLSNFSEKNRYAPYSFFGVNLSVPVFDGLQKRNKAQQSRLNLMKIDNGLKQLENVIDFEIRQANINLANAFENYGIQKRNLKLAEEVVRVSKIKYKQGVGSSLEVTNAEAGLKESQTNYYSALYDFIIARIDLDKAQGQLLKD
jgi:outer membrane protein TolC